MDYINHFDAPTRRHTRETGLRSKNRRPPATTPISFLLPKILMAVVIAGRSTLTDMPVFRCGNHSPHRRRQVRRIWSDDATRPRSYGHKRNKADPQAAETPAFQADSHSATAAPKASVGLEATCSPCRDTRIGECRSCSGSSVGPCAVRAGPHGAAPGTYQRRGEQWTRPA